MRRVTWYVAVVGVALGFGAMGGRSGLGQTGAVPPPPPPGGGSAPAPVDLGQQTRRMGQELRVLVDLIARDLDATPQGARLVEETRELAQSMDELPMSLRDRADRFEARRSYVGLDSSLHNLFSQLSRPGLASPAITRQLQRIGESDVLIHRTLGLNDYPVGYHGGTEPLSGMIELQRLTHALVDRAEALAAVVRADVAGPIGARLIEEAVNLARAADVYHDALKLDGQIEPAVKSSFAGVAAMADTLQGDLAQVPVTPRVRNAWQAYHSAEVLVRRALGYPTAPEQLTNTILTEMPGGGSPVTDLANQLVKQTADFIQVFSQTAGAVPEGRQFLADAQALEAASGNFRQDAARDLSPSQLAFEFREIDAIWQRLARRTNRIARGRTGPNIQQMDRVGNTIAEIHRLLGLPGYAPVVPPLR